MLVLTAAAAQAAPSFRPPVGGQESGRVGGIVRSERAVVGKVVAAVAGRLTVKVADGSSRVVEVPATALVRRLLDLDRVKAGEVMLVTFATVGGVAEVRFAQIGAVAPGPRPAKAAVNPSRFTGSVERLDGAKREVVLRSADGETRTFAVHPRARIEKVGGLDLLTAGDEVTVVFDPRSASPAVKLVAVRSPRPR